MLIIYILKFLNFNYCFAPFRVMICMLPLICAPEIPSKILLLSVSWNRLQLNHDPNEDRIIENGWMDFKKKVKKCCLVTTKSKH